MSKRKLDADNIGDDSVSVGKPFLRITRGGGHGGVGYFWTGDYVDRVGVISVYRQHDITRLDYVFARRLYMRTFRSYLGDRTIMRQARKMMADVRSGAMK